MLNKVIKFKIFIEKILTKCHKKTPRPIKSRGIHESISPRSFKLPVMIMRIFITHGHS